MDKITVGVFFGGKSVEHEVSIRSAEGVIKNLDRDKYDVIPVGVGADGRFFFGKQAITTGMPEAQNMLSYTENTASCSCEVPALLRDEDVIKKIDVVIPIMHGSYGEDGSIQGLLRMLNVPFVGPSVLGSALGIDKDVTKRLLKEASIPCVKSLTFYRAKKDLINYEKVVATLGSDLFVKPACLGSSVGVSKACTKEEFLKALDVAFLYDNKVVVEEFIRGREIECAVLGNEEPVASGLGEIVLRKGFYSYESKYGEESDAQLDIPAKLPHHLSETIRHMAVRVFEVLSCEGLARVDFFVGRNEEVLVNEINTMPGFTEISMYPKLWEAAGLPYKDLLSKLIELALQRYKREQEISSRILLT